MTTENKQIMSLIEQGFTPEQIAESLGYEVEAVKMAVESVTTKKTQSVEELIAKYRPEMIQVLVDIAQDSSASEGARVMAARVIVEGKGVLPEVGATKLTEMFQRMKRVIEGNKPSNVTNIADVRVEAAAVEAKAVGA